MFNVGGGELLVVLLIALVVLGPDKLPEYSHKVAKVLGELRRVSQGFQDEMKKAMDDFAGAEAAKPQTEAGPRLLGPPNSSIEASATDEPASTPGTSASDAAAPADPASADGSEPPAAGSSAA